MDIDELTELVQGKCFFAGAYKNTLEDVVEVREILKASYKHNEFPYYSEFEHSWNMLRENSSHNVIEREQIDSNPLNSFLHLIESGFYPPPELLIVVASCFRAHMISGGKTNLSEDFFGKDKQFDHCINVSKITKYTDFEFKWVIDKKESLQAVAEKYLLECSEKNNNTFGENTDVESFLRGYRRWKKDLTKQKYY
ncbi:hypothetical protein [Pseudoalteromonas sp. SG45-1]|uniref:hypothetical protein n=1 Tax=Pseudoalteromonas sp. SG45-1 TaxID=2760957 RepID=UPI0016022563|nr:hypothetical protein [Pseudoalteromonas sp. SG45-1]MBB1402416.1 hypothetical protein [Pseudoalteromonas sp. SG45-1]